MRACRGKIINRYGSHACAQQVLLSPSRPPPPLHTLATPGVILLTDFLMGSLSTSSPISLKLSFPLGSTSMVKEAAGLQRIGGGRGGARSQSLGLGIASWHAAVGYSSGSLLFVCASSLKPLMVLQQ